MHIMHASTKAPIQGTDMAFPAACVKAEAGAPEMSNFGEPEALAWWDDVGKQWEANISVGVRKRQCTFRGNNFIHIQGYSLNVTDRLIDPLVLHVYDLIRYIWVLCYFESNNSLCHKPVWTFDHNFPLFVVNVGKWPSTVSVRPRPVLTS